MRADVYRRRLYEEPCSVSMWRDVFAEFIATFMLVSVQSALPLTWETHGLGGPVQTALGMGFIVVTMAWTFGDYSGGHMNPAVTFSMAISAKITIVRGNHYYYVIKDHTQCMILDLTTTKIRLVIDCFNVHSSMSCILFLVIVSMVLSGRHVMQLRVFTLLAPLHRPCLMQFLIFLIGPYVTWLVF